MVLVMVALLVCVTGTVVLAILFRRVTDPDQRRRLRAVSKGIAIAMGGFLLSSVWLSTSRHVALLFRSRTPEETDRLHAYLDGGLYAILATAALLLALRLVFRITMVADRRLKRWARAGQPIQFRGLDLVSRSRVRVWASLVTRISRVILMLLLLYSYVPLILSLFPSTAPYAGRLFEYIWRPAAEIGNAVLGYLPKLVYLVLLVVAVRYCLKLLRFALDAVGRGNLVLDGFDPEWADPTYKLLRSILVVFTLMVGFPYLPGAEAEFFRGFSLFVGALVTLGSTAAIGNMVAGVILTYTRAFHIGDRVRIGDSVGDVTTQVLGLSSHF